MAYHTFHESDNLKSVADEKNVISTENISIDKIQSLCNNTKDSLIIEE